MKIILQNLLLVGMFCQFSHLALAEKSPETDPSILFVESENEFSWYGSKELIAELIDLFNEARSEGRSCGDEYYPAAEPVNADDLLAQLSKDHNEDMAKLSFRGHKGSDGRSPHQRIQEASNRFGATGEILAYGARTPQQAVSLWLRSPGHCSILMSEKYTHVGADLINVGDHDGSGRDYFYWTAKFAGERNPRARNSQVQSKQSENQNILQGMDIKVYSTETEPLMLSLREELEILGIDYDFRDIGQADNLTELQAVQYYAGKREPLNFPVVCVENRMVERVGHADEIIEKLESESTLIFNNDFGPLKGQLIKVYGRENCNQTSFLTRSLKLAGYDYQLLNIATDEDHRRQMWTYVRRAGLGRRPGTTCLKVDLPVVVVGDKIVMGTSTLEALINAL